jgi:hypothetical protein
MDTKRNEWDVKSYKKTNIWVDFCCLFDATLFLFPLERMRSLDQ